MRACTICGDPLTGRSPRAKFCSDKCRKRKERSGAPVVKLPSGEDVGGAQEPGLVESALLAEMHKAGTLGTSKAAQAVLLARRLDTATADTGSSLAALSKELDRLRVELLDSVAPAADPLDELMKKRRERAKRSG